MIKTTTPQGPAARLQERLADRDNNFDVLRLGAAVVVLVFHAFSQTGHSQPVVPLTDEPASFAGLLVFFAISGFLVSRSWLNEPRVLPFAIKRGLRILPGLLVVLLLTAYVIGPLATTRDRGDYLSDSTPAEYVVGRSLLLSQQGLHGRLLHRVTGTPGDVLPGVFATNPIDSVNGSLWTLPVEITAYVLLALGGLLVCLWRRRWPWVVAAGVLLGAGALALHAGQSETYSLYAVFAGGVALYALRGRVQLHPGLFALAVVLWIGSYQLPPVGHALITGIAVPYAVVFLAFRALGPLRWLTRPGDLSYGIYIYAWPVQQLVIVATGTRSPALVIAMSAVATYLLAFASWRAVERPALRLKGRLTRSSAKTRSVRSAGVPLAADTSGGR